MVWGVFNDGRIEFFCQAQNKVLKDLCRFGRLDVSLALRKFNWQLISKSTRWPSGLSLTIQVGGRMKKVAKVWDFSGFKLLTSGEGRFSGEVYGEALIFFFFFFLIFMPLLFLFFYAMNKTVKGFRQWYPWVLLLSLGWISLSIPSSPTVFLKG